MKILFVSSEVEPFAKSGGLADVAGSLPIALTQMGHDVRIVMPCYSKIESSSGTLTDFPVTIGEHKEAAIIRKATLKHGARLQIPIYFVDNYHYFDRPNMYVYHDDGERFGFFCKAITEMLTKINFIPDIIHCNDWHSGLIPLFLREKTSDNLEHNNIATVFTIHNLHYQGNFPKDLMTKLHISDKYYHPEAIEFYGDISFIKSGILYSNIINTVSNRYAEEIQTPNFGERLEGLLRTRSNDLFGIVNGIDTAYYNPKSDNCLVANYGPTTLNRKVLNKQTLQEELSLPVKEVPVLGLISRLVNQKGLDLIEAIMEPLMKLDLQLIILGTGDLTYERLFTEAQAKYPDKVAARIEFDKDLAKRIYAGSDMFLMPSRFEPCGLGQLIALRYGTIPIVRFTGGLADTITDFEQNTTESNGFGFTDYNPKMLLKTIERALKVYNDKNQWQTLVQRALKQDWSWIQPAKSYEYLYKLAMEKTKYL